jgi:hypothetical protein
MQWWMQRRERLVGYGYNVGYLSGGGGKNAAAADEGRKRRRGVGESEAAGGAA